MTLLVLEDFGNLKAGAFNMPHYCQSLMFTESKRDGLDTSNYYVTGAGPQAIPEIIPQDLTFLIQFLPGWPEDISSK